MKVADMPKFGILRGIKVLNCSSVLAAPFACALFSDHGADVIHVESAKATDVLRGHGRSYSMEHRNQRNLALDMSSPEGKEIIEKLIKDCDIFVESSKAGTWANWGLDDEYLWKIKPDLVIAHVSGYGQSGDPEYVKKPAYDMVGQAFSGYIALNGMAEAPLVVKPYTCDYFTGFTVAWSCLAALLNARKTGKGESIDVAMYEAMARVQTGFPLIGFNDGVQPPRLGNGDPQIATDVIYKTKDEQFVVIITVVVPQSFIELIGLGNDPDFNPAGYIKRAEARAPKYMQAVRDFVAAHTLDEVIPLLEKAKVACGPILDYKSMLNNSQYKARNTIVEWHDPISNSDIKGIGVVPKFAKNPGQIFRGSPTYGMDNEDVLSEIGLSEEVIKNLYEKGILAKK